MALTVAQKEDFLIALAETGRIHEACEATGLDYEVLRRTRLHDKAFVEAFDTARRKHGEQWERATHKRGIDGWDEPVFHEGKKCGVKRKFSDRCLELGLKRFCPEYREKMAIDATISGGVLVVGAPMTEDEWREKYGRGKDE